MSIIDHPQVLQVLFHPRPDYPVQAAGVLPVTVEVEPGISVGGCLYPYNPTAPAILYFHGNGEIASDYNDIAQYYHHLGVTLLVMDYRGYGRSGGKPTGTNLLADALTIFNAVPTLLAEQGFTPSKLFVMGRSLGSVSALEIASRVGNNISGLIIESGFANSFKLLSCLGLTIEGADEMKEGFFNHTKITQVTVPTLIIHGEDDRLISATEGKILYQQCTTKKKQLLLIPYAGHNDLMILGMKQYFSTIGAFVTTN